MIWKKITFKVFLILSSSLIVGGCNKGLGSGIPIIGLGEDGKLQTFNISKTLGTRKFGKLMNEMSTDIVNQLDRSSPPGPWKVSKLIVGLDLSAGFDVGLVDMSLGTLIELRFSRI